jgi:mono/diheme cytochrome c family protein
MRCLRRAFGILGGTEAEGLSAYFAAEARISKRFTAAVSSRESLIRELEMRLAHVATSVTALLWIAGCAPPHDPRANAIAAVKGEPAAGEALYRKDCAQCHGDTGAKLAVEWPGMDWSARSAS